MTRNDHRGDGRLAIGVSVSMIWQTVTSSERGRWQQDQGARDNDLIYG